MFFPRKNYYWQNNDDYNIHKLNSSNGDVTTLQYSGGIPTRIEVIEVDDNDNIYIGCLTPIDDN